ncbi:ribonuclease inhibitor [Streptomyces sp. NBC_01237]|uniref:ribonuclease inhibitor n=1 Tax=Streptomyces sp. NBC_01237 TaxID=2903790 RepID=UPI002DD9235C|nr:ribonuclease inhibitor [Streptomyces sp. NBC_01237]WRZ76256.1 ribonuclease inhibitor [Streptomyces sp. NBC_01237]
MVTPGTPPPPPPPAPQPMPVPPSSPAVPASPSSPGSASVTSSPPYAGVPPVLPRSVAELGPLLGWLHSGVSAGERLDFPSGTALPDGRLDLCKQALGPRGAALVAGALRPRAADGGPAPVRHLLLGTDGLGDEGAGAVADRSAGTGVETLYLGCNRITAGGACRIADSLRASEHLVTGVWLKRNPLGTGGGQAAAQLVEAAATLRTLDLVQTGLDAAGTAVLAEAMLTAAVAGRPVERLFIGGNALGPVGAAPLAALLAAGAITELYVSAARLGDEGADVLAAGLARAPYGRTARISVASNGIGPRAAARLVTAAATAGVRLLDLGRVRAAGTLGAPDNHIDTEAAARIGSSLAALPHLLTHLVLSHTGMRSREAHRILDTAADASTATRYVLGKGIATSVRRRLDAFSAHLPRPTAHADVAAVRSVHRTVG